MPVPEVMSKLAEGERGGVLEEFFERSEGGVAFAFDRIARERGVFDDVAEEIKNGREIIIEAIGGEGDGVVSG